MPDALSTGAKVLASLDLGRARAIAKAKAAAAPNELEVRRLLDLDINAGHGVRGRAGRIARRMRKPLTPKGVQKILERLSSGSVSLCSTPDQSPDRNNQ
jgi:hypothetical protein